MYGGPGYEQYIKSSLTGGWGEDANAYCLTLVYYHTFMTAVIRTVQRLKA